MADRVVAAPVGSHGGRFGSKPRCIVIHSVESEATPGLAWSLANGWLQTQPVSVHAIADPVECVRMVPIDTVAYHCGGGNSVSVGIEHTGKAAWTFQQWTSGDSHQDQKPGAFDALRNGARCVAEWCKALGIPRVWLTPAEAAAGARGLITHNTARLAFGGTTHTDPGPGFPYAIYLKMVQQFYDGKVVPDPTTPTPTPGGPGGAEGDDMYDDAARAELVGKIDQLLWLLGQDKANLDQTAPSMAKKLDDLTWTVGQIKQEVDTLAGQGK